MRIFEDDLRDLVACESLQSFAFVGMGWSAIHVPSLYNGLQESALSSLKLNFPRFTQNIEDALRNALADRPLRWLNMTQWLISGEEDFESIQSLIEDDDTALHHLGLRVDSHGASMLSPIFEAVDDQRVESLRLHFNGEPSTTIEQILSGLQKLRSVKEIVLVFQEEVSHALGEQISEAVLGN